MEKLIIKVENLPDKNFLLMIWCMRFFCVLIGIIIYFIEESTFNDFFYLKTIIFFTIMLLLSVIFITTILLTKVKEYNKRSLIFENKDKFFLEKEYELFIDLIKEEEKMSFRILYLFFIAQIGVFLFFFDHLNNIEGIEIKIDTILHNEMFFTLSIFLWVPFFLMFYINYFNEKLNLCYLNKLMNISERNNISI